MVKTFELYPNSLGTNDTNIYIINNHNKNRSFSESDLTDPYRLSSWLGIKYLHEYISIDDLNIFRRKKYPPGFHTKSIIHPQTIDESGLPFNSLESEYSCQFKKRYFNSKPSILRRSTSLHLEGLMQNKSEHQEQFQPYTFEDYKLSRGSLIKKAENLCMSGIINMEPEYRSSYISYPMVNRTSKILPREAFRLFSDPTDKNPHPEEVKNTISKKLIVDKITSENSLQQICVETKYNTAPSEYKQQFVRFPIEKACSIPQISHLKIKGEFGGVPEYKDSFKTYETYLKSAPIKKGDNLRMPGAQEVDVETNAILKFTEHRAKLKDPTEFTSNEKLLKVNNHINLCGQFSKDLPEYYESFRDPQIKHMPERSKCREPYLRLKGKIEFNPEYRNTFLDFPRSRPVIRKPVSTLRLSNASNTSKGAITKNIKQSLRPKLESCSTNVHPKHENQLSDIIITPEYRRANYQYQMRERTPVRNLNEKKGGDFEVGRESKTKFVSIMTDRKNSFLSTKMAGKQKRRILSNRLKPTEHQQGTGSEKEVPCATKNAPKYGRRASVLPNSSVFESSVSDQATSDNPFVVLNEPYKQSPWTKKSWYES
ncbi:uncharacterized protein LOC126754412 isoform X2 [Bactrocera neohumeralis]|uniref:uncharacterized protein LOC126754412 isoform X2 n=1 Tax=Bactrocera neohumeralis TaxID=98809 RepID=UPI0021662BFF|nr:uncharacterized protein LOC126754412 isoform X2 [Bactrocera neohumeralis]